MDQVGAAARYGMMMVSQRRDAPVAELQQTIEAQNAAPEGREALLALLDAPRPPPPLPGAGGAF